MNEQTEIVIEPTVRGFYRVRFPQKPNESAIRGFHGILTATGLRMKWDKTGKGDVYWTIPPGMAMRARRPCLEEAVDMIRYWYGEAQKDGTNRNGGNVCTVRVVESSKDSYECQFTFGDECNDVSCTEHNRFARYAAEDAARMAASPEASF